MSIKNDSGAQGSGVGQTNNIGRSTSVGGGAAKVFREFKWGLLTLFLLMVVVIGLVYDGGRRKKQADTPTGVTPANPIDTTDAGPPPGAQPAPVADGQQPAPAPAPAPVNPPAQTGGTNGAVTANPATPPATPPTDARSPLTLPGDNNAAADTPQTAVTPTLPEKHAASISKTYTVKAGDTLTKIAISQCGGKSGVKALLAANKELRADPNMLRPGMTLKIPATTPVAAETHTKVAKSSEAAAEKEKKPEKAAVTASKEEYVVQAGDTLEKIARKVFKDSKKWHELYDMNRDQLSDPSRLHVGQTLHLKQTAMSNKPAAASIHAEGDVQPAVEVSEPNVPTPVTASMKAESADTRKFPF